MTKFLTGSLLAALVIISVRADDSATMSNTNLTSPGQPMYYSHATWDKRFGIGAIIGEPIGVDAKYWINDQIAIDGALGVGFYDDTDFYMHADALWHMELCRVPEGRTLLYFGVGPRLKLRDDDRENFGLRFPVGVSYMFDRAPIDLFAEIAPIFDFTPEADGAISGGVGIRFWF